jgi:hypothetical protein
MKNVGKIDIRVPRELLNKLERERRRVSKITGVEVNMSSLIRALVLEGMRANERRAPGARA